MQVITRLASSPTRQHPPFDSALTVHGSHGAPLVWLGLYDCQQDLQHSARVRLSTKPLAWYSSLNEANYTFAHERIRQYIAAGDSYQVNFTYPLQAHCDPESIIELNEQVQGPEPAALIHGGDSIVYSMSPELFFSLDGERIVTRPMKGTAARGLDYDSDQALGESLAASTKDRAENVMIVDLLRNDLGRIAKTGTVTVETLFEVERHPTVWQMTSTISAKTKANVPEIFQALFPCGSVTGAPKVRAMQIIHELEEGPRGVYCGVAGVVGARSSGTFLMLESGL